MFRSWGSRRATTSAVAAVLIASFAVVLQPTGSAGRDCPAGYRRAGSEESGRSEIARLLASASSLCVRDQHPESLEDLEAMAAQRAAIQSAPFGSVPPGAFTKARAQKLALLKRGQDAVNSHAWQQIGRGPLQSADAGYDSINKNGHIELAGRITSFFYVPKTDRYQPDKLFASVGYGGVWMSDSSAGRWVSIGEGLPTQVVGAVGYTSYGRGTVIALTGDGSFGFDSREGGGAYYSTDLGRHWTRSAGVPDEAFGFKISVDKARPNLVYAATGSGLYRSADGGRSFANVNLPTGACAGKSNRVKPCLLANIVTDVVVAAPGGKANNKLGKVLAAVGWRGGNAANADGTIQSPNNGLYESDTGNPGTFRKLAPTGFVSQDRIGRVELGEAVGPDQDHNIVYAMVQDAILVRHGLPAIDAPGVDVYGTCLAAKQAVLDARAKVPADIPEEKLIVGALSCHVPTVLNGVYASRDWGQTWTLMADASELMVPGTGSALGVESLLGYAPGAQAWYNEWIKPDPTRTDAATGAPTRVLFGLEEVWANVDTGLPATGPAAFKVIGRYWSGASCEGLDLGGVVKSAYDIANGFLGLPPGPLSNGVSGLPCPTNGLEGLQNETTTHPDQHDAVMIPTPTGVTLVVGNDGGVYKQIANTGTEFSNAGWGKGNQTGFNTLLPYDAVMAKDGVAWIGLQDNGSAKIVDIIRGGKVVQRGRIVATVGGDGFFVAVDPNNSKAAFEEYTYGAMQATVDGGHTWSQMDPPVTDSQFSTPFVMDPKDATHLMVAGRQVLETQSGGGTSKADWVKVFDLGTALHGGSAATKSSAVDPANSMTAIDLIGANAYVGFCGTCDVLNAKAPFKNGLATNVGGSAAPSSGTSKGWHMARAIGLPNRYITGLAVDPANPKTVYLSLGGYIRPWTPPGMIDKNSRANGGHIYVSHDAGAHFTDVSGNLPDVVVNWVTLRGKQVIAATDQGVFVSKQGKACEKGCAYQVLGKGLPVAPAFTARMAAGDPNLLIAAVYGRGVYGYRFGPAPAKSKIKALPPPKFLNALINSFDFETSAQGWANDSTSTSESWRLAPPGSTSLQGFQVLPYVDKATASLRSPKMTIPARSYVKVQWDELRYTEPCCDYLTLDWSSDGKKWFQTRSAAGLNPGFPNFATVSTQFVVPAGSLYLRFRLTSDDLVSSPPYLGVIIDNVIVKR